mmetsp:Transcript_99790/g.137269  ORF Transcript_99790/g.137269 Transcript_99790/m.137269 type:complete len:292 (-) Transcript_99790:372-1247(-)|eukprot:CAMPEP_0176398506 /NCGR_PEP_ID=MMETSP0126-20121128/45984_1 /TAXON_ID=141414 ORGANISM="Strombidinopsis acuminatum, Strain SPMC142" /NCGR_SAMPLE_ID=MMETSP0126 /ASSEMBLY_ACC=CAM_ASM_000229 /LENGTH=291 /DNA_ID=CAMNT_0017773467 /DNA_START=478 /DNA_END=1353 /DNA_ORIENTATION=-
MTLENKQKEKNGFTSSKLFKQKLQENSVEKKDDNGAVKKRRCFVSVNNKWRQLWDYFIIFVAIYSTFMIPISLAFNPFKEVVVNEDGTTYEKTADWYTAIDTITTCIYFADIVVQFRTSYINNYGEEIFDLKKVTKQYVISQNFWIDLFSLFANPITDLVLPQVQFLGLLKINRVFRVGALITQANMDKNTKAAMKIFYFTFLLFIYIHLVGCMWFLVVDTNADKERRWIPPYDFIDYTKSHFFEDEILRRYYVCLYYSVLIIGGNELGPSSDLELFFIVSANLIGAIVNA